MQALRYASYISKWRFEDFESLARNFMGKIGDPEFNFNGLCGRARSHILAGGKPAPEGWPATG